MRGVVNSGKITSFTGHFVEYIYFCPLIYYPFSKTNVLKVKLLVGLFKKSLKIIYKKAIQQQSLINGMQQLYLNKSELFT